MPPTLGFLQAAFPSASLVAVHTLFEIKLLQLFLTVEKFACRAHCAYHSLASPATCANYWWAVSILQRYVVKTFFGSFPS